VDDLSATGYKVVNEGRMFFGDFVAINTASQSVLPTNFTYSVSIGEDLQKIYTIEEFSRGVLTKYVVTAK